MIVTNAKTSMESNVPLNQVKKFGVDADNMELVMEILSKLYSHPIRTMVQEYICNGRDAMREAGTWGKIPMVIGLPNTLEPTFKVRDYGVGISPERMDNVFVFYGSSTKRSSNVQTGGFGIGSKSFRCYTDSMSVTSFVDGIKYVYVIQPSGCLLISQEKTKEPNGVEISIGVKHKDISAFFDAVQRCVRFWKEPIKFLGTTEGSIKQLTPVCTIGEMDAYLIGNDSQTIYLIDGIEYDMLQEDHLPYWQRRQYHFHSSGYAVAINVPNGKFKLHASREQLEVNDNNKNIQTQLLMKCTRIVEGFVAKMISNPALTLKERLLKKTEYSAFAKVSEAMLQLDKDHRLGGTTLTLASNKLDTRYCRRVRRGQNLVFETNKTNLVHTDRSVIVDTSTDSNEGTLARRLNYYLSLHPEKTLILTSPNAIPYCTEIFDTIIKSETLPLPPKNNTPKPPKSTREVFVFRVHRSGHTSQQTVESFNRDSLSCVGVDEVTEEAQVLASFLPVYRIPKSNKKLVTRKYLSIEEGIAHLSKLHKEDSLIGIAQVSTCVKKLEVMKDVIFADGVGSDLLAFLESKNPQLKDKRKANKAKFDELLKKYPLIQVLMGVHTYDSNNIKILVSEINKQTKDNK
jgi:hypothetical protein